MHQLRIVVIVAASLALHAGSPVRANDAAELRDQTTAGQDSLGRFAELLGRLTPQLGDWTPHYESLEVAATRMYERNGWTSESDEFSLDVLLEIESIPPWQFSERMELASQRLAERYQLDEQQHTALDELLKREAAGLVQRNFTHILRYAPEAIQTRASGSPFTAEQVARWTTAAAPVFEDLRATLSRAGAELGTHLSDEQRAILQRDLSANLNRMSRIETLGTAWSQGGWTAEDWGLETDPIQSGQLRAQQQHQQQERSTDAIASTDEHGAAAAAQPAAPKPSAAAGEKKVGGRTAGINMDDLWAQHVQQVVEKYGFTREQEQSAWRLYRRFSERRDVLLRRLPADARAAALQTSTEPANPASTDLQRLFQLLSQRLERIPTRAQRAATAADARTQPAAQVPAPHSESVGPRQR